VSAGHAVIENRYPAHRRAVLMLLATAILWSLGGLLIKGWIGTRWRLPGCAA
jgi:hypothetical protein